MDKMEKGPGDLDQHDSFSPFHKALKSASILTKLVKSMNENIALKNAFILKALRLYGDEPDFLVALKSTSETAKVLQVENSQDLTFADAFFQNDNLRPFLLTAEPTIDDFVALLRIDMVGHLRSDEFYDSSILERVLNVTLSSKRPIELEAFTKFVEYSSRNYSPRLAFVLEDFVEFGATREAFLNLLLNKDTFSSIMKKVIINQRNVIGTRLLRSIAGIVQCFSNNSEPLLAEIFSKQLIASLIDKGSDYSRISNLESIARIVKETINNPEPLLAEILSKERLSSVLANAEMYDSLNLFRNLHNIAQNDSYAFLVDAVFADENRLVWKLGFQSRTLEPRFPRPGDMIDPLIAFVRETIFLGNPYQAIEKVLFDPKILETLLWGNDGNESAKFIELANLAKRAGNPNKVLEKVFSNGKLLKLYRVDKKQISAIIGQVERESGLSKIRNLLKSVTNILL